MVTVASMTITEQVDSSQSIPLINRSGISESSVMAVSNSLRGLKEET